MSERTTLIAPALLGATRVGLGALWVHEGVVKWHAGFGRADILLVADGARSNSRVPGYFEFFADHVLRPFAGLAGFAVPVVEVGLGVALILGVLTLPVALASLLNLITYWASDQLVTQYPLMAVLSTVLIAWAVQASHFSISRLRHVRAAEGSST